MDAPSAQDASLNKWCEALHALALACVSSSELDPLLTEAAGLMSRYCGGASCQIWIIDEDQREAVLRASSSPDLSSLGNVRIKLPSAPAPPIAGLAGWLERQILLSSDYPDGLRTGKPCRVIPLIGDGLTIGFFVVAEEVSGDSDRADRTEALAALVAPAICRLSQYQAVRAKAEQLSAISELSKTVSSSRYVDDFLDLVVTMTARALEFDACSILLVDAQTRALVHKATSAGTPENLAAATAGIERCLSVKVAKENRTVLVADSRVGCGDPNCGMQDKETVRSYVAYPLRSGHRVIGAFCGYYSHPHSFSDEEVGMVAAVAGQAALAIQNSQLLVKGAIVQEMHHRVKNNLQTIASLLRMQRRHAENETVVQALDESISRIQSIATVHEILAGEDLDVVSMRGVADRLLQASHQMTLSPDCKLSTALWGGDVLLPARQATTAALILNELIHNALKHGIGRRPSGRIEVSLGEDGERIVFIVANDGEPLPADFDLASTNSLGLQIVKTLVRGELQGTFVMASGKMTAATVEFPCAGRKTA